jgi:tetratricopeptide (TPR) repeat protein
MLDKTGQIFERGKSHLDEGNFDKAINDFAEAIRLTPRNAEYYAWLAFAFLRKGNYEEGFEAVNQALALDKNCAMAYRVRGGLYADNQQNDDQAFSDYNEAIRLDGNDSKAYAWRGGLLFRQNKLQEALNNFTKAIEIKPDYEFAYRKRGDIFFNLENYSGALQDYSEALALNPKNESALWWRGEAYKALHDIKNALADRARYYEVKIKEEYSGANEKFKPWYRKIHQHFSNQVLPTIKNNGEHFIEYWPCMFFWGKQRMAGTLGESAFVFHQGFYGTGYLCLTDKNIFIISFGDLTRQFPLFEQKSGFSKFVSGMMDFVARIHVSNNIKPELSDRVWEIPYKTILGAQIPDGNIELITAAITWEIHKHFSDPSLETMLTAINMGITGDLVKIWSTKQARPSGLTFNVSGDVFMGDNRTEVRLGDNATIHGDLVVANSIKDSFNKAVKADISDELKIMLKELSIAVGKMSETLSKEEARRVAQDLEVLMSEATSEKPDKRRWEFSIEGLKKAAKDVGEIGKHVLDLATRIAVILSGVSI